MAFVQSGDVGTVHTSEAVRYEELGSLNCGRTVLGQKRNFGNSLGSDRVGVDFDHSNEYGRCRHCHFEYTSVAIA